MYRVKGMKKITVDNLIARLEAFLRDNPNWADAEIVVVVNCLIVKKRGETRVVDLEEI